MVTSTKEKKAIAIKGKSKGKLNKKARKPGSGGYRARAGAKRKYNREYLMFRIDVSLKKKIQKLADRNAVAEQLFTTYFEKLESGKG